MTTIRKEVNCPDCGFPTAVQHTDVCKEFKTIDCPRCNAKLKYEPKTITWRQKN